MFLFITVILISILCGVEVDVFTPSLPEIRQVFGLTPAMVQLVLSVNFLAYCVFCLFAGALGDRFNRRIIILLGLWIFVVGSMLCVFSSNFYLLLAGRFLQGVGISAPTALTFAEIIEQYPAKKLAGILGIINGVTTIAMAFAPVIGSYINLHFTWHGNFVLLLGLGLLCVAFAHATMPNRRGDPSVSISVKAYVSLLKMPSLLTFMGCISFLIVPYWLFIGISPILYMENLGVSLPHFGFYQGALAGVFSILSLASAKILATFGQRRCLYFGIYATAITAVLILWMTIVNFNNPLLITVVMMLLSISVLFPLNILFPLSAALVPNAKGRITALIISSRLFLTAIALQTVGFFYHGNIFPVSLTMFICLILFLICMRLLLRKKWVDLAN